MPEVNEPVTWIAPDAVLRLQRSSVLGEKVLTVDGGVTFDARVGEFTVKCEEWHNDVDERLFDIEIESSARPQKENLWYHGVRVHSGYSCIGQAFLMRIQAPSCSEDQ